MAPTVLFVPGWWVGTAPFAQLNSIVTGVGLKAEIAALPSTGTTSPGNPSMKDDIASVRKHIESILARDEDVLLVLHSAGGFIGGAASTGLTKKERGSKSGVAGVVFLSGAVFPEGFQHQAPPFTLNKDGACTCADPNTILFGDLSESEQSKWVAALEPQPEHGWDDKVPFAPWKDLPSVYVVCENDNALPAPLQEQLAGMAGSKVEKVQSGHMPMLVAPQEVANIIQAAAAA